MDKVQVALSHLDEFVPLKWRERWLASICHIARIRLIDIPDLDSLPFEEIVRQLEEHTCRNVQSFTNAKILVIDGASGTGKNHLGDFLRRNGWESILRYKDRSPRTGEQNGIDAYFISPELFTTMQEAGEFVGVRGSFGERRAYRRAAILDTVRSGKRCYNAEGLSFLPLAADDHELREIATVSVFLLPPSLNALITRIVGRMCGESVFESWEYLFTLLQREKVTARLEYGFNDLVNSIACTDPRRPFLADIYACYDTPHRIAILLGIG